MLSLNTNLRGNSDILSTRTNNMHPDRSIYSSKSAGLNSKSLPHTRRNSLDLSAIWTTIQALDLDDANHLHPRSAHVIKSKDAGSVDSSNASMSYASSPAFSKSMLSSMHTDEDIEAIILREARESSVKLKKFF